MLNTELLAIFHCGFFAAIYITTALAIVVYHKNVKGTIPLVLVSLGSALAHILVFLLFTLAPDNRHLQIGLMSYYTWASPTIMLCIKEAISPGWLTWSRYFKLMSPFLVCTALCLITANINILYVAIGLTIVATIASFVRLNKEIAIHEQLIKEYFTDLESFGNGWIKGFMYFQIATVFCMSSFLFWRNTYFEIFWNYLMTAFWIYFLIRCKQQHYFSRQVPDVILSNNSENVEQVAADDSPTTAEAAEKGDANQGNAPQSSEPTPEKYAIVQTTLDFIEKRLKDIDDNVFYSNANISLVTLAQLVGTNRTYMSGYFRAKNTTFWDYVNTKRCNHAIELMKANNSISMQDLSQLCGFRTSNCFRTTFTTIYGTNPSSYKKIIMTENAASKDGKGKDADKDIVKENK